LGLPIFHRVFQIKSAIGEKGRQISRK